MALFKNDVSEYIAPREAPARLVVTFARDGDGSRYSVTAQVDEGDVTTGQFVVNPEWRGTETRAGSAKAYVPAAGRTLIGRQLFSALFSGALSRCWAQAVERSRQRDGLHLVIRSDVHAIQSLPWELLSNPTLAASEFVAMAAGWSILRDFRATDEHEPGLGRGLGLVSTTDLGILLLTTPLLGIDPNADPDIVRAAFDGAGIRVIHEAGAERIVAELKAADADIVHVLGTGRRGQRWAQDLVVGDRDQSLAMPAVVLTESLRTNDRVRLVVLAACETDLLAALVASVVPAVIGIRGAISDAGCQAFLGGLYVALAQGATVTQAVAAGRAQQIGFSRSLGDEWAQPVLFLSQDGPLVRRASSGIAQDTSNDPTPRFDGPPGTAEQHIDGLLMEIRQANLLALNEQWERVDGTDTPTFVQTQIVGLTDEVKALSEGHLR